MSESRFIDGIFNYCDRWCERCSMTERCRLFADSRRIVRGSAGDHEAAPELWDDDDDDAPPLPNWLTEPDEDEEAEDFADAGDFDPFAADEDEDGEFEIEPIEWREADHPRRRLDEAREHPLTAAAEAYAFAVHQWCKERCDLFDEQGELILASNLEREQSDATAYAAQLSEAADVVRWYEFQITAKLFRALSKGPEDRFAAESDDFASRDADGSAKVALIGIERSIGAWTVLRDALPAHAEQIAAFLQTLTRLRTGVDQAFPNARAFIRPGFDDPSPG